MAVPPLRSTRRRVASAASGRTSLHATLAPYFASISEMPEPIFGPAPVTSATLPSNETSITEKSIARYPEIVMDLGRIGIWSAALRRAELPAVVDAVAELDELGFGALWFPGGDREGFAERMSAMLRATQRTVIAPGIVSVWTHPANEIAAEHQRF